MSLDRTCACDSALVFDVETDEYYCELCGSPAYEADYVNTCNLYYVIWLDGDEKRSAQRFPEAGYKEYLKDHPIVHQYHAWQGECLYHLATVDNRLFGLDHVAITNYIDYLQIPF